MTVRSALKTALSSFSSTFETSRTAESKYVRTSVAQDTFVKQADIINTIYPVGSIYISTVATNPNTIFGVGTWSRIGEGRTLIDAGSSITAGTTGGSASVSYTPAGSVGGHSLTTSEIPNHQHSVYKDDNFPANNVSAPSNAWKQVLVNASANTTNIKLPSSGGGGTTGTAHNHGFTGTAATINTRNPYLAVYIWKRMA